MPIFWWGLLLIMFFAVAMRDIAPAFALPVSGRIALEFDVPARTDFMLVDAWLAPDEGAGPDEEKDDIAEDVGPAGYASSAEEAAVHVRDEADLDG